jgi:restriction system protein
VVTPFSNNELLVGIVDGDFYFKMDDTSRYYLRKNVKWFPNHLDRHTLSVPLQNTLRSSLTCFSISSSDEILQEVGMISKTESEPKTILNTSISNTELIRKRFLELDATEFELLVSYVLRTLGFDPKQETGKVGDGGIDFEGVLDVMGVASVNLQVQVKRYEKNVIGEKDIRNFRGALKKDFQGCFITLSKFNKKAVASANDVEREPIKLIDGFRFTEIFIEQYDKIIETLFSDDLDELADKLKFKKSLLPI